MADRRLLPIRFKDEFGEWLKSQGFTLEEPKGDYEVLRARRKKRVVIVYSRLDMKEHFSLRDCDCAIVRTFLKERKKT